MKKITAILVIASLYSLSLASFSFAAKLPSKKIGKPLNLSLIQKSSKAVSPSVSQKSAIAKLDGKIEGDLKVRFTKDTTSPHLLFTSDGFLSAPTKAPIKEISKKFIQDNKKALNLSDQAINSLDVLSSYSNSKLKMKQLVYEQEINGLPVFDSYMQFNTTLDGKIINVSGHYATDTNASTEEKIPSSQALDAALKSTSADIDKLSIKPKPNKCYYIDEGGAKLAWQIFIHKNDAERYVVLVNAADGKVVLRANLVTSAAQGYVATKNPSVGFSTVSFSGWVDGTGYTIGNNVDAHLDWFAEYGYPSWGSSVSSADRAYASGSDFASVSWAAPGYIKGTGYPAWPFSLWNNGWFTYQNCTPDSFEAVVNLFYHNNYLHDWFNSLGFTEAAGNFQHINYSGQGEGNDRVQADAQDGYQYDNAFFFTPPDGNHAGQTWGDGRPRMTMHLFTPSGVGQYIDSAFDGQIMTHEYGHGVSNRLVGGPENGFALMGPQSGAMGEGWSDYWAMTRYNDTVMGAYANGDLSKGMRHYNYATSPLTYANFGFDGGPEVHNDGEIWATAMWDIEKHASIDTATARNLIITGIALTPPRPTFLDGRDAILAADTYLYGGAYHSILWSIFANRGMGVSARTTDDYAEAANQAVYSAFDTPSGDTSAPSGYYSYPRNGGYAKYNHSEVIDGTRYYFIKAVLNASDNVGISKVSFYFNSALSLIDRLSPYTDYYGPGYGQNFSNGQYYTFQAYVFDRDLNYTSVSTRFKFDNYKPRTYAPRRASGRRNGYARLYYKAYDPYTGGRGNITLRVKTRSGRTIKTYRMTNTVFNSTRSKLIRLTLSRGTYKFYVYASDKAGNSQNNIARNYLTVR